MPISVTLLSVLSQSLRWKWVRCFSLLASFTLSLLPHAGAAEFNTRLFNGRIIDSTLEGEIQPGDYDRFVTQILNGGLGTELWLNSPGGDVFEAMKIGRLVRELRLDTHAPDRVGNTAFCSAHPQGTDLNKCSCASACFLIFVAGVNRHGSHLGIHRVFPSHDSLKFMTPDEAAVVSGKATNAVSAYLAEMGVPIHFIQRLMVIPSNKIEWVSEEDISRYFSGYIPQLSEWVAAKCPKNPALWDELRPLIIKNKTQSLTANEERRLSELSNAIIAEADCRVTASREIRSDAEAKVATKLKSLKK